MAKLSEKIGYALGDAAAGGITWKVMSIAFPFFFICRLKLETGRCASPITCETLCSRLMPLMQSSSMLAFISEDAASDAHSAFTQRDSSAGSFRCSES